MSASSKKKPKNKIMNPNRQFRRKRRKGVPAFKISQEELEVAKNKYSKEGGKITVLKSDQRSWKSYNPAMLVDDDAILTGG